MSERIVYTDFSGEVCYKKGIEFCAASEWGGFASYMEIKVDESKWIIESDEDLGELFDLRIVPVNEAPVNEPEPNETEPVEKKVRGYLYYLESTKFGVCDERVLIRKHYMPTKKFDELVDKYAKRGISRGSDDLIEYVIYRLVNFHGFERANDYFVGMFDIERDLD
ncbi:hypothetical protein D1872_81830 [compost metagenome]